MEKLAIEKFYFIRDYSGNSYRLDSGNQLVVAGSDAEATVFSFVEANERINGKSRFYTMSPVPDDVEESEPETDILSLEEEVGYEQNIADSNISMVKELTELETLEEVEKSVSEYDLSKIDWKEYLTHFTFLVTGLADYRVSLDKGLSDIDMKICDILHYIELCETGDEEATELVELLRVCRENRRDVKDEIVRVEAFQKSIGNSVNVAKVKDALKTIKGLESRKYTPRKYTELFGGKVFEGGPRKKRNVKNEVVENQMIIDNDTNSEEEEVMEYTRRNTPYDEKQNDWMAFAMQQAEFYRNAGQYIVNLQMDLDDIDNEIASLLEEMETANCNVAQGYKLFKRMKELRLARKEKEKELECLYILTEHYDMNAMANESANNVEDMERFLYGDASDVEEISADMEKDSFNDSEEANDEVFAEADDQEEDVKTITGFAV